MKSNKRKPFNVPKKGVKLIFSIKIDKLDKKILKKRLRKSKEQFYDELSYINIYKFKNKFIF